MKLINKIKNYSAKKAIIPLAALALATGYQSQAQNEKVDVKFSKSEILYTYNTKRQTMIKPQYADMNNDGKIDILIPTKIRGPPEQDIKIAYNLGNGKFSEKWN